jgi:putative FmdB family regulatory protein
MPIQEYHCKKCGNVFENIEIDVRTCSLQCPDCGSKEVQKQFSLFASSKNDKSSCRIDIPST